VEVVDGTPTTSVARTLADLGNVAGVGRVRSAFIAGERRELIDMREVEAVLSRAGRTPGARRLRDVVRRYDPRWQQTRSGLEVRAFESLRRHGVPLPEVNAQIGDRYLADLLWRDARLVVEIDSDRFHANPIDRRADARRDAHLRAAGYTVLRIPEAEIAAGADPVALRVTAALAAGRPRER
jgi:very-short-patch-repair endonuclease